MMKVRNLMPLAMIVIAALMFGSCKPKTPDVVVPPGNWVTNFGFKGNGRSEAVSFSINNVPYIGLGYDGTSRLSDFYRFDTAAKNWVTLPPFPGVARNSAVAFVAAGKAYVGTGYDGVNKFTDFYSYDPTTNKWSAPGAVKDFPGTGRYDAVAFALNDKGYVGTGYDGTHLKDFYKYDPTTNTWTTINDIGGNKRRQANAWVLNGKAYVCAGVNNGVYIDDFWEFDPATGNWNQKRSISNRTADTFDDNYGGILRSNATSFVIGGKAYLSCGFNGSPLVSTWQWDPSTDLWITQTDFESPARQGAVVMQLGNRAYVATGTNGSFYYDDFYEFQPGIDKISGD